MAHTSWQASEVFCALCRFKPNKENPDSLIRVDDGWIVLRRGRTRLMANLIDLPAILAEMDATE